MFTTQTACLGLNAIPGLDSASRTERITAQEVNR